MCNELFTLQRLRETALFWLQQIFGCLIIDLSHNIIKSTCLPLTERGKIRPSEINRAAESGRRPDTAFGARPRTPSRSAVRAGNLIVG